MTTGTNVAPRATIHQDERNDLRRAMSPMVWDTLQSHFSDDFLATYGTLVAALYVGDTTGVEEVQTRNQGSNSSFPLKDTRVLPLKVAADAFLNATATAVWRWRFDDPRPVSIEWWHKKVPTPRPRRKYRGRSPRDLASWVTKDLDKLSTRLRSELHRLDIRHLDGWAPPIES